MEIQHHQILLGNFGCGKEFEEKMKQKLIAILGSKSAIHSYEITSAPAGGSFDVFAEISCEEDYEEIRTDILHKLVWAIVAD